MASEPTQEDAKLLLQLYDLRREKLLRRARDFVQRGCKFKNYKDFEKRYPLGSKERNYIGMVLGYWNLACTLVGKGLLNEELFQATNFEHVGLWFKFKPVVEEFRKQLKHPVFASLEAVAGRHPAAGRYPQRPPAKKKAGRARAAAAPGEQAAADQKSG